MPANATFEAWERQIHAFAVLDPAPPPPEAGGGPLSGLSFAVKDVIDVAGLATRNGSETCAGAPPAGRDAEVVRRLRAQGARCLGKTVTTEFAFTDPTDCRNPHDLGRSPGGSSSGSGAAVAAGLVDMALGTQTAGSLCRPAAYCGAVGVKPSYGSIPTAGVTPLAPSFDTVGIIARSVDVARRCLDAVTGPPAPAPEPAAERMRAVCGVFATGAVATPETLAAHREAARALAGMTEMHEIAALPADAEAVVADHRTVMHFEAHAAHGHRLAGAAGRLLRPKFRAALEEGARTTAEQAGAARARLAEATARFWSGLSGTQVVLTLPVPDGAPLLGETTGFQHWLTPWTVFGGPLVSLPWGVDTLGRPRAVMLAGHPGSDRALLGLAALLEAEAPPMPVPALPAG